MNLRAASVWRLEVQGQKRIVFDKAAKACRCAGGAP